MSEIDNLLKQGKLLNKEELYQAFDEMELRKHTYKKVAFLYDWYLEKVSSWGGGQYILHGVVTGHTRISDHNKIHTTSIEEITVEKDEKIVFITRNTKYHCLMKDCNFTKTDTCKEIDFAFYAQKYNKKCSQ